MGDIGRNCLSTVDGTDFKIRQPAPFWNGWYSHKFNAPAVKYEVGVSIQRGDIVWVNGPFPGKWHDMTIFCRDMKGMLDEGERVEADDGYRGGLNYIETCAEDYGSIVWKKKVLLELGMKLPIAGLNLLGFYSRSTDMT